MLSGSHDPSLARYLLTHSKHHFLSSCIAFDEQNMQSICWYRYNEIEHFKYNWLKKKFLVNVIFLVMYVYINDTANFQKEEL